MKKISIANVKYNNAYLLRALDFYKLEIGILKERLTEIARRNTNQNVMKMVEHFQNQFIVQLENIDKLAHNIKINTEQIAFAAKQPNAGYIDETLVTQAATLRQDFSHEEKTIADLRHEFNEFAVDWM